MSLTSLEKERQHKRLLREREGKVLVDEADAEAILACFARDANPPKTLKGVANRLRGRDLSSPPCCGGQAAIEKHYFDMVMKQAADDRKFFDEKKPGWFHGKYYDWRCGEFVVVETANSDNSLNYPD